MSERGADGPPLDDEDRQVDTGGAVNSDSATETTGVNPENGTTSLRHAALLWIGLYVGVSGGLYILFGTVDALPTTPGLSSLALGLGAVITGVALLAVVADRLLFDREPDDIATKQSVWVLVLIVTTTGATAYFLAETTVLPGTAVALGVAIAVPTTMLLFAVVNVVRHRSLEHGN